MTIEIDGVEYYSVADVQMSAGVTRQTLWRWRKARKIPQGRRFRDGQLVFSAQERAEIQKFANRLEPAGTPSGTIPQTRGRK